MKEVMVIDGETIENSHIYGDVDHKFLRGSVGDADASRKLSALSVDQLKRYFSLLEFDLDEPIGDVVYSVSVNLRNYSEDEDERVFATLSPQLTSWSKPWSFNQYFCAFSAEFALCNRADMELKSNVDQYSDESGVEVTAFPTTQVPVSEIMDDLIAFLRDVHEATERRLVSNLNRGSLVTFFDFPPAVKAACEQYLQYFIQFLDDLGIEADSQITSEAGRVMFSVTPRSGVEALASIQEALQVYLKIPNHPANISGFYVNSDVAVMQLSANVMHLQSQLMLAQSMHQLNQATIQAKTETINAMTMQLNVYQSGQLLQRTSPGVPSIAVPVASSKPDAEPLIGESVKVTVLKIKGLEIDLPNLLRSLKRRLPGVGR